MEILNYALAALVVSTGLILGKILARIAKEEIKPGEKYFLIIQKSLFCAVIVFLMYLNKTNVHYIWIGGLIIFTYLLYFKKINPAVLSAVLGLAVYLSSKTDYFVVISSLTFLYWLPVGTLMKKKKEIALNLIVFLIVAIGLFIL
ncbi:hypothetical protein KY333_04805 [Candidatus Woesearchaeota archaeon]|nr:hypothetical protein [Candidatus Woesearchaeota archaeon]